MRGITKIEILIVVLIIGVLGLGSVYAISDARSKTRDAVRLSDIRQTQAALELYFNDQSEYPVVDELLPLGMASTTCLSASGFNASCSSSIETVYMKVVSATPKQGLKELSSCGGASNAYCYLADEVSYLIQFELENDYPVIGLTKGLNCAREDGLEAGGC